jgi:uncharacterized protein YjiK
MKIVPLIAVLSGLFLACQSRRADHQEVVNETPVLQPPAYDLDHPTARHDLPRALREVSGLTFYRDNQLACVQDEDGDLFLFDVEKGKVTERLHFGPAGDYEGVEYANGNFYVLRSDGLIFVIRPDDDTFRPGGVLFDGTRDVATLAPALPPGSDVEGLGYDPRTKRLLIALKETPSETKRYVYFYDFGRKVAWKGLVLSPLKVEQEAGLSGKDANLKPSGVAVHPKTGELYVLAAEGAKLLVLDRLGIIRSVARLDPNTFRQPEGLCFTPDGTLFIASEGKDGEGYLLKFTATR